MTCMRSRANYLVVPVSYSPQPQRHHPCYAFLQARVSGGPPAPTMSLKDYLNDHQYHSHQGLSSRDSHHGGTLDQRPAKELIEAACEEEAYLNASSAETNHPCSRRHDLLWNLHLAKKRA